MTKNEFFARLEARLNVLDQQERNDIIDEYRTHIEFKMQDGKTEEQAIADFGDVDALAEEILSAYHINSDNVWNKNGEYYIKKSVSFINSATEKLLSFSLKDVAKVVVEFLLVLVVVALISIPFDIIGNEIVFLFGFVPNPLDTAFSVIVKLAVELINLAIAFVIIYSFVKARVINRSVEIPDIKESIHNSVSDDANFDVNTGEPLKKAKPLNSDSSFGKVLTNIFVWCIKIMAFAVLWLPAVILTICVIVVTVLLTVLLITKGIGLWGICIIGAGCCVIGIGFTAWTTQLLFGGKNNG